MLMPMRIYKRDEHLAEIEVFGVGNIAIDLINKTLCPVHTKGSAQLVHGVWHHTQRTVKLLDAIESLAEETFPGLKDGSAWMWGVTIQLAREGNN